MSKSCGHDCDDFAFRRGHVYGTILIDLERRCPIDLLPDREAKTLEDWLRVHPGVEILSRDRSTAYTDAANKAIPHAVQVADRWHLVRNLAEGVTRFLDQHRADIRAAAPHLASEPNEVPVVWPPTKGIAAEEHRDGQRAKRRRRFNMVKALQEQGMSQRKIATILGLSRGQVKRFAHADAFPEIAQYKSQPTSLDLYKSYLQRRWKEGCHNGQQLFREIKGQGFAGSCSWVSRYITGLRRGAAEIIPLPRRVPASRSVAALFLRSPEDLSTKEQRFVDQLCQAGTLMETVYDLTHCGLPRRFVAMVRLRQKDKLPAWLADVQNSGVHGLNGFAKGLIQDLAAVEAGLSLSWSNGPVEGQVNRLKLVKRSMYGRASFELLKARVLPLVPLPASQ